ncbi:tetratricopeptide repeat protein [Patescibacteria group bacterium]|nr:tetratricopeptide repeat protein [Patescibacteria group bacterium]
MIRKFKKYRHTLITIGVFCFIILVFIFIHISESAKKADLEKQYLVAKGIMDEGKVFYKLKKYDKAIESFTKAIAIYPDFSDAYLARGKAYQSRGLASANSDDLENAIRDSEHTQKKSFLATYFYYFLFLASSILLVLISYICHLIGS